MILFLYKLLTEHRVEKQNLRVCIAFLALCGAVYCAVTRGEPYERKEFNLNAGSGEGIEGVIICPKTLRPPYRIALLVRAPGDTMHGIGVDLINLASLGYAAVGFDYDEGRLAEQFPKLIDYLSKQKYLTSESSLWISLGETKGLFAQAILSNSVIQPSFIAHVGNGWEDEARAFAKGKESLVLKMAFTVIQGRPRADFSPEQKLIIESISRMGLPICASALPSYAGDVAENRPVAVRMIAEQTRPPVLALPPAVMPHARSWATPLLLVLLVFIIVFFKVRIYKHLKRLDWFSPKTKWLWRLACLSFVAAIIFTCLHTAFKKLPITPLTKRIATTFIVDRQFEAEFLQLSKGSCWAGVSLDTLFSHASLTSYTAFKLANWSADREVYDEYLLNPIIAEETVAENWREPLWRYFYPVVKKEQSIPEAAKIVVRHLRRQVSVSERCPDYSLETAWSVGLANIATFQKLYVAALRSVAIPARIGTDGLVYLRESGEWKIAPPPLKIPCFTGDLKFEEE